MNRKKLTSASLAGMAAVALFAGACAEDDTVSPGQEEVTTQGTTDDGLDTTTTTGDDDEVDTTTGDDDEVDTTTGDEDGEATTTEGETTTTG